MDEFKPCPFCGANKPFRTVTPESGIPSGDSGYRMTIKCRDRECGCIITRWALKKAWAIESAETAWNRRAQPVNEPLTHCGECIKYQTQGCSAKHEQALMDFCSHGMRRPPEGSENDGEK